MKIKLLGLIALSVLTLGCGGDNEIDSESTNITGTATITGLTQLGEQLTASLSDPNGTFFNAPGTGISAYIWSADGAAIPGADQMQYTLTAAEVGSAITVTIAYVDNAGFSEVVISAPTVEVTSGPPNVAGTVSISGSPQAGQTLTASVMDSNGFNNDAFYEWFNGSTSVQNGTSDEYVLPGGAIAGDQITVNAMYTDGDGYVESPTSAPVIVTAGPAAGVIINDSFADGDRTSTGALDADWWSSSQTSGSNVQIAPGALTLVTGTSGRGMHATFAPQTLADGDSITVTYSFTTPATIGAEGTAFKIALMDLDDPGLAADQSSSSSSVNPLYVGQPGYFTAFDVDPAGGGSQDTDFRKHDVAAGGGRFLGTTGEWTNMSSSADAGYLFLPNTAYIGVFTITRTGADSVDLFSSMSLASGALLDSHTTSDSSDIANNFGMLGFWVNSDTFGSSNSAGNPDNGLTFTNVTIETTAVSSSSAIVDDSFADGDRASTGALDADWWSSSQTSGSNVQDGTVGSLTLVTGTSGRGMHATFMPQTLADGDSISVTYSFTTPATIGEEGTSFKIALMDLDDPGLAADQSSSSSSVNPLYVGQPGYFTAFDVSAVGGGSQDTDFRKHDVAAGGGRFLGTTGEWTNMSSSADAGYLFLPNTAYIGVFTITRTGADSVDLFSSMSLASGALLDSHTTSDSSGIANNFGMLGFWVNSDTFGSSNSAGNPDNGLIFTNVLIERN